MLAPRRPNTNMGSPCGPKALGAEQQAGPGQPPNTAAAAGSAATWGSCGERSEKLNNNPAESTLVGISAQFILKPLLFAINFRRTSSLRRHNHFFFCENISLEPALPFGRSVYDNNSTCPYNKQQSCPGLIANLAWAKMTKHSTPACLGHPVLQNQQMHT